MSYIHKFESFRQSKNTEKINEEILGTLFNWAKGYFAKAKAAANKVKGGKDLQAIYDKYLKIINDQLASKAKISLNLKGEQEMMKAASAPKQETKTVESILIKEAEDQAPVISEEEQDDDSNAKLDADTLRQKLKLIQQIIDIQKKAARKEMDKVLQKYGGNEKNPDLKELIDAKIQEFDLALLNAEIEYLEQAGDKGAVQKLRVNREKKQKEIEASYKKIGTEATKEITVDDKKLILGKKYRYKTADGIKTIIIKGESEEEGKVQAAYTYGDSKDEVQNFTAANIDTQFTPVKNNKYRYFSQNNNAEITVTAIGDPDDKGLIQVKTGENEFSVEVGALLDKKEETE
jgi:hypothetical protein